MQAVQTNSNSHEPSVWSIVASQLIFFISFQLAGIFLPNPVALCVAGGIMSFVIYFNTPKKKVGFFKFFFAANLVMLSFVAGFYWLAPFLENFIPTFWAFFLPFVLLSNLLYLMPSLIEQEPIPYWKWFLGSLVFGALFAYFIGNSKI